VQAVTHVHTGSHEETPARCLKPTNMAFSSFSSDTIREQESRTGPAWGKGVEMVGGTGCQERVK
jgi:hypothetical protein